MSAQHLAPDRFQFACKDCKVTMSGDNMPDGARGLWASAHGGHDTEEKDLECTDS